MFAKVSKALSVVACGAMLSTTAIATDQAGSPRPCSVTFESPTPGEVSASSEAATKQPAPVANPAPRMMMADAYHGSAPSYGAFSAFTVRARPPAAPDRHAGMAVVTVANPPSSTGSSDYNPGPTLGADPFDTCCPSACEPCCATKKLSVSGFAELLYWSPRGVDVPYALPVNGFTGLATPHGAPGIATTDYEYGFRCGVGFAPNCSSSFGVTYAQLNNHNTSSLDAGEDIVLRSLVVHPATLTSAPDSLSAVATYDVDFKVADADYRYTVVHNDYGMINLLVGGRYGHLDQTFDSSFEILGRTRVATDIGFDGGGPRVGLESKFTLPCGFVTYGRGSASFLVGSFEAKYQQENVFAGVQAETSIKDDRIVTPLEFEAGLGWQCLKGHLLGTVGYHASGWYNAITTPGWINAVQSGNFNRRTDNLSDTLMFEGFVARVEFRY